MTEQGAGRVGGVGMCISRHELGARSYNTHATVQGFTRLARLRASAHNCILISTPLWANCRVLSQVLSNKNRGALICPETGGKRVARSKLQARVAEILAIRIGQFAIKENYRPEWLTSERGERLELDFYINDLRIAFEVQGLQHYQYTPHFHGTPEGFEAQLLRDESKRNLCWFHNIRLYEVADESDLQKVLDQVDRLLLTRYYSESLKKSRHGWHITKEREKYIENKMRPVSERIRKFKKVIAKASARLAEALESGADADRCEHLQRRLAGHVTQYKAMSLRLLKGRNSCALYWDTEIFPKYHGRKPIAEKG